MGFLGGSAAVRVLGIETSCDETGVAIYDSERGLVADLLYSQAAVHREYGGVVPELASRDHIRKTLPMVDEALRQAGGGVDAVAYTAGPGLIGALLVGASLAKGLALAWGVPALGVHHMEGHLLAAQLAEAPPPYPFVALLVSGGHTQLLACHGTGEYELLGESVDDAAGEAFDKVAKMLGLPYPGGPALAALAEQGNRQRFKMPRPMTAKPGLDFSFSGLKTYAYKTLAELAASPGGERQRDASGKAEPLLAASAMAPGGGAGAQDRADLTAGLQGAGAEASGQDSPDLTDALSGREGAASEQDKADLAAGFQEAVADTLFIKCDRALRQAGLSRLVVAGGVAANTRLRERLAGLDASVHYPPLRLCTDNGAMIAYAGYVRLQLGQREGLEINARARWPLSEVTA